MSGMGGLFELVLVLAILLGWGFVELRSTRLDKKKAEDAKKASADGEAKGPQAL